MSLRRGVGPNGCSSNSLNTSPGRVRRASPAGSQGRSERGRSAVLRDEVELRGDAQWPRPRLRRMRRLEEDRALVEKAEQDRPRRQVEDREDVQAVALAPGRARLHLRLEAAPQGGDLALHLAVVAAEVREDVGEPPRDGHRHPLVEDAPARVEDGREVPVQEEPRRGRRARPVLEAEVAGREHRVGGLDGPEAPRLERAAGHEDVREVRELGQAPLVDGPVAIPDRPQLVADPRVAGSPARAREERRGGSRRKGGAAGRRPPAEREERRRVGRRRRTPAPPDGARGRQRRRSGPVRRRPGRRGARPRPVRDRSRRGGTASSGGRRTRCGPIERDEQREHGVPRLAVAADDPVAADLVVGAVLQRCSTSATGHVCSSGSTASSASRDAVSSGPRTRTRRVRAAVTRSKSISASLRAARTTSTSTRTSSQRAKRSASSRSSSPAAPPRHRSSSRTRELRPRWRGRRSLRSPRGRGCGRGPAGPGVEGLDRAGQVGLVEQALEEPARASRTEGSRLHRRQASPRAKVARGSSRQLLMCQSFVVDIAIGFWYSLIVERLLLGALSVALAASHGPRAARSV